MVGPPLSINYSEPHPLGIKAPRRLLADSNLFFSSFVVNR